MEVPCLLTFAGSERKATSSGSGIEVHSAFLPIRKREVPENLRDGAYPNALFASSESVWINTQRSFWILYHVLDQYF